MGTICKLSWLWGYKKNGGGGGSIDADFLQLLSNAGYILICWNCILYFLSIFSPSFLKYYSK